MPIGSDGDGGHHRRVQAVAHGIDDRHVQGVVVEGVVEAVPGHVVCGLQDPGDGNLRVRHDERRQQGPLHLRGQTHRLLAAGLEEPVGVHPLGDQYVSQQTGEAPRQAPVVVIPTVRRERQHTHPIRAVQQRREHPHAVPHRLLDQIIAEEGPTSQRAVDRHRYLHQQTSPGQRHQGQLVVVLEQDGDVPAADHGDQLRNQGRDELRWHLMSPVDQRAQQPLAEALRPVDPTRGTG